MALVQKPEAQAVLVALDAASGRVRALVGSFDYTRQCLNHATQAWRQPGSSLTPFLYSVAPEQGVMPATLADDAPLDAAGGWDPQNDDGRRAMPLSSTACWPMSRAWATPPPGPVWAAAACSASPAPATRVSMPGSPASGVTAPGGLVAVAWIGHEAPRSLGLRESGTTLALPMWIDFMSPALQGKPVAAPPATPGGLLMLNGDWVYREWSYSAALAALGRPAGNAAPMADTAATAAAAASRPVGAASTSC